MIFRWNICDGRRPTTGGNGRCPNSSSESRRYTTWEASQSVKEVAASLNTAFFPKKPLVETSVSLFVYVCVFECVCLCFVFCGGRGDVVLRAVIQGVYIWMFSQVMSTEWSCNGNQKSPCGLIPCLVWFIDSFGWMRKGSFNSYRWFHIQKVKDWMMLYGLPMKWRDTKVLVLRVEHKHKQMNMCIIHHPNSPRSIFHQQEQIKEVLLPAVPTKCLLFPRMCWLKQATHPWKQKRTSRKGHVPGDSIWSN